MKIDYRRKKVKRVKDGIKDADPSKDLYNINIYVH